MKQFVGKERNATVVHCLLSEEGCKIFQNLGKFLSLCLTDGHQRDAGSISHGNHQKPYGYQQSCIQNDWGMNVNGKKTFTAEPIGNLVTCLYCV